MHRSGDISLKKGTIGQRLGRRMCLDKEESERRPLLLQRAWEETGKKEGRGRGRAWRGHDFTSDLQLCDNICPHLVAAPTNTYSFSFCG